MPELSIIVPVYKVERYLPKCIDSILAQTFTDFELILIDDGSPDRCGQICDEYAAKDERITVIHQENKGVSAARNAGLDIAKGTYIGFVDSDDWIEPEMYMAMMNTTSKESADVVLCGFQYFNGTEEVYNLGGSIPKEVKLTSEQMLTYTLGINQKFYFGAVWNKLFHRKLISNIRFNPDLIIIEDWLFVLDAYKENLHAAIVLPEAYYHYRADNNAGLSKTINPKKIRKSLLSFYWKIPSYKQQSTAIIRFLDDAATFLPRIRKVPKSGLHRLSIKLHVALILIKSGVMRLNTKTERHKYTYEALIHS